MPLGIGFGSERIGFLALRFPKAATAALLALVAFIALSLSHVTFDKDIHRTFLSDSPLSQAQRAYAAEQDPPLSTVLVHVESPEPLTAQQMGALRDLSLDFEFIEGVTAVASPFVLRWPPDRDAPSGTPVFGPEIAENFAQDLTAFRTLQTGLPTFVTSSATAVLLALSVDTNQTTVTQVVDQIAPRLDRVLQPALSARITGEDVISAEIVAGLKDSLISLNIWGVLAIALAACILLRDLRMVLLATAPAVAGAAGVLALSVWLGYPITVLSNVIPVLLLVLGVADGVHLAGHIKSGGTAREAVSAVGPACGLTALTTAVAFASITLSGNAQLFEFAILGAVGTLLSFVIVMVSFALLAKCLPLSNSPLPKSPALVAQVLAGLGTARPGVTVALCFALLTGAAWGFSQTTAWFPLYQNLPDDSAMVQTNDRIAQDFGGVFQMIIETDGDWDQTHALVTELEGLTGAGTILAEVDVARWLGRPTLRPTSKDMAALPEALVGQLRATSGASRIFVSVPEPMRSPDTLAAFDKLYDTARARGAQRVLGLPTIMRREAVDLVSQLSMGLVAAALGATLLVALAFRSANLVPALIIPNTLPLMLTGASLHLWAEGQLTPTAVLALTIAFGIAIDDTVHFLSRYAAARNAGQSEREAVKSATRAAGQVMVVTTLLLTIGLSVTLLSEFTPIRLFGGMMILTLWAALLVDLLLLPALLILKGSRHVSV
ncbi:putative RND superfamily transporter [Sulfitobacter indolifex HEL-45]|uniref:RND superfamily transporter n=1 Tax=Sulfitobacter indolifex HEL-45 TaxID=391624 RepID=A0ABM9X8H3_9RHOB|nr:putative RND superfamily transporter [Sulfitobacter indolifex HEL-45]